MKCTKVTDHYKVHNNFVIVNLYQFLVTDSSKTIAGSRERKKLDLRRETALTVQCAKKISFSHRSRKSPNPYSNRT